MVATVVVAGAVGAGSGAVATLLVDDGFETEPVTSCDLTEAVDFGGSNGLLTSKRPEFEQPARVPARSARVTARNKTPERASDAGIWLLTHTQKSWSLNKHCAGK